MPHVLRILCHLIQLTQRYWERIKSRVIAVLPLEAYVRGKGTSVLIDKLSTLQRCVVRFTHYLLCACGNISWYPCIRSLCKSQSWCKHFGGGNIFFLYLDQTTIPCSLSIWPADHTTFTGLTHLMRSTGRFMMFSVITNIYNKNSHRKFFFPLTRYVRCVHHS